MSYFNRYRQIALEAKAGLQKLGYSVQYGDRHQFHNLDQIWDPNAVESEYGLYKYKSVSGSSDVQQADINNYDDVITTPPKTPFCVEQDVTKIAENYDDKITTIDGTVVPPQWQK